jgi:protein MpaA
VQEQPSPPAGRRRRRGAAVALAVVMAVAACAAGVAVSEALEHPAGHPRRTVSRMAREPARARLAAVRTLVLGRSVQGRPIRAVVLGPVNARAPVLVVGCIHGDEPAGIAIADRLARARTTRRTGIWIISDLNPDGVAAGTRQSAHHVDLNRNFPYAWRRIGVPGDPQYAGPRALSEPESRIAHSLILRIRPRITIWFHQHQDLTDISGGNIRIERRFALLSGLPLRRLTRYPGSATGWQDHRLAGSTAFVVELPPGQPRPREIKRIARAVLALASQPLAQAPPSVTR